MGVLGLLNKYLHNFGILIMNPHLTETQANVRNTVRATGHSPLWVFLGDAPQVFVSVSNVGYPQTRQYYQLEDDRLLRISVACLFMGRYGDIYAP